MQNTHPKMVVDVRRQPAYFFAVVRVNSSMLKNERPNMGVCRGFGPVVTRYFGSMYGLHELVLFHGRSYDFPDT